jgi:hypothetical protein
MKKLMDTKDLQIWEMGDGSRFQKCKHTGNVKPYPYKRLGYWAYRKLSDDQIREIWEKYHKGRMSSGKLSKEYGVSDRLVMKIVKGLYRNEGGDLKDSGIRYAPGRGDNRVLN